MACGAQVLATSVSAIPDMITDQGTGFLLESTAPEHIAQRIIMLLNSKELEKLADNSEGQIKKKITKTAATERYDKTLREVLFGVQRQTV
jgi:glycosyltransferase involved in cell wall biosynthesis